MAIDAGIGGAPIGAASINRQFDLQASLLRQLGAGERIESAADDPAGLAVAERLRALESAMQQGVRNLNDGISVAQTAEGGLAQTSDDLARMRELTVQANNGTLNDSDRAVIQQEYDQLAAQVTQTSQATNYADAELLNGDLEGGGAAEFTGGSGAGVRLEIADQSAAALGVEGRDVSDPATLDALDHAIDSVSDTRGGIGATIQQLRSQVRNETLTRENTAAARSRIQDADFAQLTAERTKHTILMQSQLGLRVHSRAAESAVLSLIG